VWQLKKNWLLYLLVIEKKLVVTRYNDWIFSITKPCDPQKFWSPMLWWLKILGHNLIVAVYWMAIKFFQLPRNGACRTFLESPRQRLSKKMHQANLMWQPKHFSCHNYYKGGNQFFYVAIQHIPIVEWWLKFFNHLRRHGGDDFFCQKWYYHDSKMMEFFFNPHRRVACHMFLESPQQPCGRLCYNSRFFFVVTRLAIEIHFWLLLKCQENFSCVHLDKCDGCVKTNTHLTLDAKWPRHVCFDNIDHILRAQFLFLLN
jgi:hypothetical protein